MALDFGLNFKKFVLVSGFLSFSYCWGMETKDVDNTKPYNASNHIVNLLWEGGERGVVKPIRQEFRKECLDWLHCKALGIRFNDKNQLLESAIAFRNDDRDRLNHFRIINWREHYWRNIIKSYPLRLAYCAEKRVGCLAFKKDLDEEEDVVIDERCFIEGYLDMKQSMSKLSTVVYDRLLEQQNEGDSVEEIAKIRKMFDRTVLILYGRELKILGDSAKQKIERYLLLYGVRSAGRHSNRNYCEDQLMLSHKVKSKVSL